MGIPMKIIRLINMTLNNSKAQIAVKTNWPQCWKSMQV
jgi:hypothetical protein